MTQPVLVPTPPPLSRLPGVELMHVGEWNLSNGTFAFTVDDLAYAVAALDCPAVRRPVLKLGHSDPRFDGEPAVGYIDNMATAEGGSTLVGDYAGMPGWLGPVLASAYPDRSIEGVWDWQCQIGHVHPFVVRAVALLGVTAPGIGTLQSLQDVAALYGVAASTTSEGGTPVTVTVHAQEAVLPNPRPTQVTASVTTDDVRRAYYEIAPWSVWIEEIQLPQGGAPLSLLTIDDSDRTWHQVEVIVGDGDGEDAVTFGDPVEMQRTFVPVPDSVDAAAATSGRVVFASRAESRPGSAPLTPAAAPAPGTAAASSTTTPTEETMSDTLLDGLRQQLGLAADADEATVLAANAEALSERAGDEPAAPAAPAAAPAAAGASPDVVPVDTGTFEQLRRDAAAGAAARAQQESEARAATVAAAVADGRIPPARRDHWVGLLAADAGAADVLAGLKPGTVPVSEAGIAGEGDSENNAATAAAVRETPTYKNWSHS